MEWKTVCRLHRARFSGRRKQAIRVRLTRRGYFCRMSALSMKRRGRCGHRQNERTLTVNITIMFVTDMTFGEDIQLGE